MQLRKRRLVLQLGLESELSRETEVGNWRASTSSRVPSRLRGVEL